MKFSQKLKQLRKKAGFTQDSLAEKLCVSRTAVSKWESGRGMPSIDSVRDIADVFSVTVDELIHSDSEREKKHNEECGSEICQIRDDNFCERRSEKGGEKFGGEPIGNAKGKRSRIIISASDLFFDLLFLGVLFIPMFAYEKGGTFYLSALFNNPDMKSWIIILYAAISIVCALMGVVSFALKLCKKTISSAVNYIAIIIACLLMLLAMANRNAYVAPYVFCIISAKIALILYEATRGKKRAVKEAEKCKTKKDREKQTGQDN